MPVSSQEGGRPDVTADGRDRIGIGISNPDRSVAVGGRNRHGLNVTKPRQNGGGPAIRQPQIQTIRKRRNGRTTRDTRAIALAGMGRRMSVARGLSFRVHGDGLLRRCRRHLCTQPLQARQDAAQQKHRAHKRGQPAMYGSVSIHDECRYPTVKCRFHSEVSPPRKTWKTGWRRPREYCQSVEPGSFLSNGTAPSSPAGRRRPNTPTGRAPLRLSCWALSRSGRRSCPVRGASLPPWSQSKRWCRSRPFQAEA